MDDADMVGIGMKKLEVARLKRLIAEPPPC
jgi:hypothetical protein